MQIVSLKLICSNTFQQERQQLDAVFFCEARIHIFELSDVRFAVIGRQFHADQQYFGAGVLRLLNDVAQIGFDVGGAETAQSVVCAEFHDHNHRAILQMCIRDRAIPYTLTATAGETGNCCCLPITLTIGKFQKHKMKKLLELLRLMRPYQWVKNAFVFTGLLFGHAWHDANLVAGVVMAFAAFCLGSSAVYIFNDIVDLEQRCV